jgi:hypothetical protein
MITSASNKYTENDFEYLKLSKKLFFIFGATSLNSIFISLIIYPLDTFKKHLQVNGSIGFKYEYNSFTHAISNFFGGGFIEMYRYTYNK